MPMNLRIEGNSSNNLAEVIETPNVLTNQLKVRTPTDATKAGNLQVGYVREATVAQRTRNTEEGEQYGAQGRCLFSCDFNGAAAGSLINTQWNTQATTLTALLNNGFLRLNAGVVTTTNTGIAINTARTFALELNSALRVKGHIRHTFGSIASKQFDFGLGMYAVAANQAGNTIEFIGFRWGQGGGLQGVLEYSTGNAGGQGPGIIAVNINGGAPYADNITKEYEVVVSENTVEFWVDRVFQASIPFPAGRPDSFKAGSYPVQARLFIGAVTTFAPVFDIAHVAVLRVGVEASFPISYRQALMGRHSMQGQQGLTATTGSTALNTVSATAPTATTGSNTATAAAGLGGHFALNGASFNVTANSNINICSFQNPAIPIAAGAASHGRNLVITGFSLGPLIVTGALTGGPAAWIYFLAVGNTAVSWATTDAVGTTALGSKAPRFIPLGFSDNVAATAAAGVQVTRNGDSTYNLSTPVVVHPGEFISLGARVISVTAITAGVFSGSANFLGYWD